MRIGAVVLHYRHWPELRPTLDALLSQTAPPVCVVVVDNDSGDGSAAAIQRAFPHVPVLAAEANGGYAAGMNLGMSAIGDDHLDAVLLLTHECLLAADALQALAARLEDQPRLGAVGPLLGYRSRPDAVFSAGGLVELRTWEVDHRQAPPELAEWAERGPVPADWLDGSCILLRTTAADDVGPLDERFFLYYEDVDYGLRLRRSGWGVECVPGARAWQEPSQRPTYFYTRNRLLLIAGHAPRWTMTRELAREAFQALRSLAAAVGAADKRADALLRARAVRDFLALGPGLASTPQPGRRHVRRSAR